MPVTESRDVAMSSRVSDSETGRASDAESLVQSFAFPPYRGETYYHISPIKHSHYNWRTSTAFFLNSLAGGSQILAALVDLAGRGKDRPLVRSGRYLAAAGGSLSTAVLISALHTPQRYYNMLRIFKATSPMSIGIWSITPFVLASGSAAVGQMAEDLGKERAGHLAGRAFGIPAALLGGMVMTYMGTELEETVTPLWAGTFPFLAPLYAAAGFSTAAAALSIAARIGLIRVTDEMQRGLDRIAIVSGVAEIAFGTSIDRRWRNLPAGKSYQSTSYAALYRIGYLGAGLILPLLLRTFGEARKGRSLERSILASAATLAGKAVLHSVLVYGGKESGLHAEDYFGSTCPERAEAENQVQKPVREIAAKPLSFLVRPALFALGGAALGLFLFGRGNRREKK